MKKGMNGTPVVKFGMIFILDRSKKFDRDFAKAAAILEKKPEDITRAERLQLLTIYKAAYHDGGKIEGTVSHDGSATNCSFCQAMRKKAERNPAHICNFCYDYAGEQYKIESLNRHSLNMAIMQSIDFDADELSIIPAGLINRINSAGDIPNKTFARNMVRLALINKNSRFAFWTKHTAALIAATDELGKPDNAVYVQSSEYIGKPAEMAKYFDYVFTVYPDEATTRKAIKNGAAECNGKKCRECGYKCYYGTHEAHHIAELLRGVNAKKRAELVRICSEM